MCVTNTNTDVMVTSTNIRACSRSSTSFLPGLFGLRRLIVLTMSPINFGNYFLQLTAPLRYFSQIYGVGWSPNGGVSTRKRALLWLWTASMLLLDVVPNIFIFVQKTKVNFFILTNPAATENPVYSIISIIDRFNKLFSSAALHCLMVFTLNKTLTAFCDRLEPISEALGAPDLPRTRLISYWSFGWLLYSVNHLTNYAMIETVL